MISGLVSKFIIDKLGRKKSGILTQCFNIVANLAIALGGGIGKSYEVMIVGRLILGCSFGLGLSMVNSSLKDVVFKQIYFRSHNRTCR